MKTNFRYKYYVAILCFIVGSLFKLDMGYSAHFRCNIDFNQNTLIGSLELIIDTENINGYKVTAFDELDRELSLVLVPMPDEPDTVGLVWLFTAKGGKIKHACDIQAVTLSEYYKTSERLTTKNGTLIQIECRPPNEPQTTIVN